MDSKKKEIIEKAAIRLLEYCRSNNWAGYDPFDGLNSRVFATLPLIHNKICRLILTQAMKRSPLNLRKVFRVPAEQNPKGLALFCSALLKLSELGILADDAEVTQLLERLIELRSPNYSEFCWGYNFSWQNRKFFLPKFEPNIICTTFSGNTLVDTYEKYHKEQYLEMAVSAGRFLLKYLNIYRNGDKLCFSYTPLDHGKVHNTNLLGAAFLSRLYNLTGNQEFLDYALGAVKYSITKQNDDGSWYYGEDKTQKWIDNFHTGYNLIALKKFSQFSGNGDFRNQIEKGFRFYISHFFEDNGRPQYFHNRTYPIDAHCVALSVITLQTFKDLDKNSVGLAYAVFKWAMDSMWDEQGYFYYQVHTIYKNKIPYMRWSQAWMLLALATLLEQEESSPQRR